MWQERGCGAEDEVGSVGMVWVEDDGADSGGVFPAAETYLWFRMVCIARAKLFILHRAEESDNNSRTSWSFNTECYLLLSIRPLGMLVLQKASTVTCAQAVSTAIRSRHGLHIVGTQVPSLITVPTFPNQASESL